MASALPIQRPFTALRPGQSSVITCRQVSRKARASLFFRDRKHLSAGARQPYSTSGAPRLTIGICREDPERMWERRAPLIPEDVRSLVSHKQVDVHIEPCHRRVFPIQEYIDAGAEVKDDLSAAHIIVGIKETPVAKLISSPIAKPDHTRNNAPWMLGSRTHIMFSHTAKGQPYNTNLLSQFISQDGATNNLTPELIDYEYITDGDGKRTVAFGWFAGVAGVLETLSSTAHAHLEIGIASPFLFTPRPHTLPTLGLLRKSLRHIGHRIAAEGTPKVLGPFIIGLTGTGNVANGCLSILSELPIENIAVKDLDSLVNNSDANLRKIYLIHAKPEDYFVSSNGSRYDRFHYYEYPESYISTFAEKIAPYLTVFLNGTGWTHKFPRLLSNEQLAVALGRAQQLGGARFTNIGDISCDVEGGLQFLTNSTTISEPFYKTRPSNLSNNLPSVQIMAVDILPASIPMDASRHFSNVLLPYLEGLIDATTSGVVNDHAQALRRATIASNGCLSPQHGWLLPNVMEHRKQIMSYTSRQDGPVAILKSTRKKVLMLGSGMVAGPAVATISKRRDVDLVIASNSLEQIQHLSLNRPGVDHRLIDLDREDTYAHLIGDADVVISLLPAKLHVRVARLCIQKRTNLVTASYASPEMNSLHSQAMDAGIILLNEIGLDPGIDHCSAVDLIGRLRAEGKNVKSFISFCGGLPAPDVPISPLGYKFSWSPVGALTAALNEAHYRLDGKNWRIPGDLVLSQKFENLPITERFKLEGIPNRDSLPYTELYNLPALRTALRGTLRYPGYSALMKTFKDMGLLEHREPVVLHNWSSLLSLGSGPAVLAPAEADAVGIHQTLDFLGLVPQSGHVTDMPPLAQNPLTPLEHFAYLLSEKLRYAPGERDMVVLVHELVTSRGNKNTAAQAPCISEAEEEVHRSMLVVYGTGVGAEEGESAMARTVGIPVALAGLGVVDGRIEARGVRGPWEGGIAGVVLEGLRENGIEFVETLGKVESSIERHLVGLHSRPECRLGRL